jgi:hypothetical protein
VLSLPPAKHQFHKLILTKERAKNRSYHLNKFFSEKLNPGDTQALLQIEHRVWIKNSESYVKRKVVNSSVETSIMV